MKSERDIFTRLDASVRRLRWMVIVTLALQLLILIGLP